MSGMTIMIQIRNVPKELHAEARARAALLGISLSDLALLSLRRELAYLPLSEIERRVAELGEVEDAPPAVTLIGAARDVTPSAAEARGGSAKGKRRKGKGKEKRQRARKGSWPGEAEELVLPDPAAEPEPAP